MILLAPSKVGTDARPLRPWVRSAVLALAVLFASSIVVASPVDAAPKKSAKQKPKQKHKPRPTARKSKTKPSPPAQPLRAPDPPADAAPTVPAPELAKPPRTKPSAARPLATQPVVVKPGAFDPEQVDWQSVAPGETPPPPRREKPATPWSAKLSTGAGIDSNTDLAPEGSESTLLTGLGIYAQTPIGQRIRLSTLGSFESNVGADVPAASAAEVFAGYVGELPKVFQLRISNLGYFARKRSVFADGTVLRSATTLQTVIGDNLAALVAYRNGAFDLELGTQGSFEVHSGAIENSRLLGVDGIAALRYTFHDRFAFRLRYSYEYSSTTGLSSRNLAGGIDSQTLPLKIGVHRVRAAVRARISRDSQVVARYDRVYATDDFSGFLNSREGVAFLGWVVQSSRWTVEGDLQYAKRFFTRRIPSVDNPNEDTVLSGTLRVDFWALVSRRLGLFALYRYEKASAEPTGLLFERHLSLSGIAGRFGGTR